MVRAYVLIQTEVGQTGRVAREVAEMQGIASAVPVAGPYDVIAIVEAATWTPSARWWSPASKA